MPWLALLASHGAAFAAGVWLGLAIQRRNGGPRPGASEQQHERGSQRAAL